MSTSGHEGEPTFVKTWWFSMFGDRLVVVALFLALAPAAFAILLIHESHLLLGVGLALVWLLFQSVLLIALHNRRVVQLSVSMTCTLLAIMGFIVAVYQLP
jgi:hypothetical protein